MMDNLTGRMPPSHQNHHLSHCMSHLYRAPSHLRNTFPSGWPIQFCKLGLLNFISLLNTGAWGMLSKRMNALTFCNHFHRCLLACTNMSCRNVSPIDLMSSEFCVACPRWHTDRHSPTHQRLTNGTFLGETAITVWAYAGACLHLLWFC